MWNGSSRFWILDGVAMLACGAEASATTTTEDPEWNEVT